MGKDDVVKHDLSGLQHPDWDADLEGIPAPHRLRGSGDAFAPAVSAPSTRIVKPEELTDLPYCSVGKMWIELATGKRVGATGWVVAPQAFITSGHCVYHPDHGGWITQAAFCPRYDGSCPKPFTVSAVYTLQGWLDGDWAYDIAACVVTERFTTAELPLLWEKFTLPPLKALALGYPIKPTSKHEFNGKRMWRCLGDIESYSGGILTMANDFTGGASGGPWLTPPDAPAEGLTSDRGPSADLATSPVFGQGFENLYDAVKSI